MNNDDKQAVAFCFSTIIIIMVSCYNEIVWH